MAPLSGVLLHMTTLANWSAAARGETYGADLVAADGFLHLSTAAQITGPANALFAGHTDAWLLVIDEARLPVPVRWEQGDPPGEHGELFPHLYAPLPTSAVVAAVPYPPSPDGTFGPPVEIPGPGDLVPRAYALEWYLARARATRVGELDAGFALRHHEYAVASQHNRVMLRREQSPAEAAILCEAELAGLDHWQVYIEGDVSPAAISAYEAAGWTHSESLIMVVSGGPNRTADPGVHVVEIEPASDSDQQATWDDDIARVLDPELREIIERAAVTAGVARQLHLAVLDDLAAREFAWADLFVAGATAQVENVMTRPHERGRGLASAVVLEAVDRAHGMGCDLVFLRTDAGDWPQHAYGRLGFQTMGTAHVFDRYVGSTAGAGD